MFNFVQKKKMAVVSYKDTVSRMLKNPMRKTFTMVGVTMLALTVFVFGAIRPTLRTISELRAEIKQRKDANEQLQEKIDTLADLQKRYEELEEDLSVIDLYFPSDMDYSLIMASLEVVTQRYGFIMQSLQISSEEEGMSTYSNMDRVEISLTVTGRLSDLANLLKHLEGMPIVANMDGVTYSPSEEAEAPGDISASIRMHTFKTQKYELDVNSEE